MPHRVLAKAWYVIMSVSSSDSQCARTLSALGKDRIVIIMSDFSAFNSFISSFASRCSWNHSDLAKNNEGYYSGAFKCY